MKNLMKLLISLSLVLVVGLGVKGSLAYFTDHTEAAGSKTFNMNTQTTVEEEFDEDDEDGAPDKIVTVSNTGEADAYVRVMVIGGAQVKDIHEENGDNWFEGTDGYWYYKNVLKAGEKTATALRVVIEAPEHNHEFQVVVVCESRTSLLPGENGPGYEGWALEVYKGGE